MAVRGPDGATHLVLCTGTVELRPGIQGTRAFFVGRKLTGRQFVGALAWGALSGMESSGDAASPAPDRTPLQVTLLSIEADYDEDAQQVKIWVQAAPKKVQLQDS